MHGNISNDTVYSQEFLTLSDGHEISVELSGNPKGLPVLYIHGGPGAGLGVNYQWPFDLTKYHIIGFDQRGCGRSRPSGKLNGNTTQRLIEDIEAIRVYLNIDSLILFGGSWGSTLALLYAINFTDKVKGLVLRGIFLAREEDFNWFLMPNGGAAQVFPEAYKSFALKDKQPKSFQCICEEYFKMFDDPDQQEVALQKWYNWEGHISRLTSSNIDASDLSTDKQVRDLALLECHYLANSCFIEEGFILNSVHKLNDLPCFIVHGRYDMVCKVEAALSLHERLPNSKLFIVDDAGHSMSEYGIARRLVHIMKEEF